MDIEVSHILIFQIDESMNSKSYLYFSCEDDFCECLMKKALFHTKTSEKAKIDKIISSTIKFINSIQDIIVLVFQNENRTFAPKRKDYIVNKLKYYISQNYE